ncbi:exported hypothetical protein [Xanthomonas phaseoli pv. phaseoli]|nr:exported hypothetical protein [Xanthomonas phaseoli pv. phaseoli]
MLACFRAFSLSRAAFRAAFAFDPLIGVVRCRLARWLCSV